MNRLGKLLSLLIFVLILQQPAGAQTADIPRLKRILLQKQHEKDLTKDPSYIDILDSLAFAYFRVSADSLFFYSEKALQLAQQAGYGKGVSVSLRIKGNGYSLLGDYTKMLDYYQQSLTIAEKINDSVCIAKATINIALMYYLDIKKEPEALGLLKKAGSMFEKLKDTLNWHKSLISMGAIWANSQHYDLALQQYEQALQIATAMKDAYSIVVTNDNIGLVYFKEGQYKAALARFLQTFKYFNGTDDKMRITRTAAWVAKTYLVLNDHRNALKYGQLALNTATEIKARIQMQDADKVLADIYEAKSDPRNALKYFRLYKDVSDSIYNEAMLKKTADLDAKYQYEKKETRLKQAQEKKDALHRHIVRMKELQILIAVLVIGSLSALAFLLFRSRAAKQKSNQILEAKNEEIERQALQLLLNNQEKDKLFSIISHDLKMPLHSLKMMLGLLKENDLPPEEITNIMDELRQDVDFSSELVSNLLSWAGSQLQGRVVSPAVLPVHELVNDTIEPLLKQAADKEIGIKNKLPASLVIWADKNMMQVLIRNLVSNAIKFCNSGDTITIDHKMVDGAVELCVADTGIGIEQDLLKRINRKESVTTFGTAKEKGTGLGMLLCREFAEANQGSFRIESEPGKGSRFYCTVPAMIPS
jgi:signal transduction histidine kinase